MFGCNIVRHAVWFGPSVRGESELMVMNSEILLGLEIQDNFFKVFGCSVDVFPIGIVLTVFQECEINSSEMLMYLTKALIITAVATDIDLTFSGFYHERCP